MASPPAATSVVERAFRFGRHDSLVGILTSAPSERERIPVVLLGAGIIHKVGPSRVSVNLARSLARRGHPVFRFDLSGIGDSVRSPGDSLEEVVKADIRDAVSFVLEQTSSTRQGLCLAGFCSGADNAFHMAGEDGRVEAVALFDPTVHRTSGFHRRLLLNRMTSSRAWVNVLSGRSLRLRLQSEDEGPTPPGYYGLLTSGPEEMDERAAGCVARGVRFLYCLSRNAQNYCNAPEQVEESFPHAYSEQHFTVAWRPEMDHLLSTREQQRDFAELVAGWLDEAF